MFILTLILNLIYILFKQILTEIYKKKYYNYI